MIQELSLVWQIHNTPFNPQHDLWDNTGIVFILYFKWENWGAERLVDLPKVAQVERVTGYKPRQYGSESIVLAPTVHQGWGREALRWQASPASPLLCPPCLGPGLLRFTLSLIIGPHKCCLLQEVLRNQLEGFPLLPEASMGNRRRGMTFQTEPPKPSCPLDSWTPSACQASLAVGSPLLHAMVTLFIQSGHLTQSWSGRASIQTPYQWLGRGNQLGCTPGFW